MGQGGQVVVLPTLCCDLVPQIVPHESRTLINLYCGMTLRDCSLFFRLLTVSGNVAWVTATCLGGT